MGDFLPDIDSKMHEKRAKMMAEREEMGDFSPESPRNVRVLSQDEVHDAKLDALREYRDKLEGKLEVFPSSPLSEQLKKVNEEIAQLETAQNGRE